MNKQYFETQEKTIAGITFIVIVTLILVAWITFITCRNKCKERDLEKGNTEEEQCQSLQNLSHN